MFPRSSIPFALLALATAACSSLLGTDFQGTPRDGDGGASDAGGSVNDGGGGADSPASGGDAGNPGGDAAAGSDGAGGDGEAGSGGAKTVTAVACGAYFTCAVASGDVYCFGDNKAAELGNAAAGDGGPTPVKVTLPGPATLVAAHGFSACASVDTEIYCWGANGSGQLGSGSNQPSNVYVPVKVNGLKGQVASIATGNSHACAVVDGAVWCWGYGELGQLGDGNGATSFTPKKAIATGATSVAAGDFFSCAIVAGKIQCWGLNNGALGNGSDGTTNGPVATHNGGPPAASITGGSVATCGVINGAVSCWGMNDDGSLGVASTAPALEPQALPALASGATAVAAHHGGCAIVNGALWCWGKYPGDGSDTSAIPVRVDGDLVSGVTATSVGWSQKCAIKAGRLYCFGTNEVGELGVPLASTPNKVASTPVHVPL